ncbi:MAG: hypothetical protein IJ538_03570 [Clostridia bacterium]|nr:hypothetical protein [Clostridia bacterium]
MKFLLNNFEPEINQLTKDLANNKEIPLQTRVEEVLNAYREYFSTDDETKGILGDTANILDGVYGGNFVGPDGKIDMAKRNLYFKDFCNEIYNKTFLNLLNIIYNFERDPEFGSIKLQTVNKDFIEFIKNSLNNISESLATPNRDGVVMLENYEQFLLSYSLFENNHKPKSPEQIHREEMNKFWENA